MKYKMKMKRMRQPNFHLSDKTMTGFAKTAVGSIVVLSLIGKIK